MNKAKNLLDKILKGKTPEEQIKILRNCFETHAIGHPWMDAELIDSILENVEREYKN